MKNIREETLSRSDHTASNLNRNQRRARGLGKRRDTYFPSIRSIERITSAIIVRAVPHTRDIDLIKTDVVGSE